MAEQLSMMQYMPEGKKSNNVIILRIPTYVPYGYIEVHSESITSFPDKDVVKRIYDEWAATMSKEPPLPATDKQIDAIRKIMLSSEVPSKILIEKKWKLPEITREQASYILDQTNKKE